MTKNKQKHAVNMNKPETKQENIFVQQVPFIHYFIALVVVVLVFWSFCLPTQALAQSGWQTPQWIPGLVDSSASQNPYFVTDPTGKIHVFHSQWVNNRYGIVYSKWTVGVGWTSPVDIIASDRGQARITGAFLDSKGMMNVIFWGGDDQNADIYFSQAPLTDAMRSTAWSSPLLIGSNAISPTNAAVVSNQNGHIVVVYSGNEEGNGLYCITSEDYGVTWTTSFPLFSAASNLLWPSALQMIMTGDGSVHAVWGLGDQTGNSRAVYHASLAFNAAGWSSPTVLAEVTEYEADTPSIIEYDDSLIVIFHNDFPTTRFMTYSNDNGETWSSPTRLFEQVGSNGPAALIIDSSNTLHMFFGNRVDISTTHGLWHSIWLGGDWSTPVAIVSGPQILIGANGEEGFDPSAAQAMICQDNLLMVVWRHDPMAGPIHIWFTYQYLDSLALPTQTIQTPAAMITSTPEPTLLPTITVSVPEDYDDNFDEIDSTAINQTLFFSITPALILIAVVLFWRRNRH